MAKGWALLAFAVVALAFPACKSDAPSSSEGKRCASSSECGEGKRCDPTKKRCVSKCEADNHCPRDSGTRCEEATGECVAAETCSADANCGQDPAHDYCTGLDCVCSPDASVVAEFPGRSGVCWRPAGMCEPCTRSLECGDGPAFVTNASSCKLFQLGDQETGVCLPRLSRNCPPGTVAADQGQWPELGGHCVPHSGDCADRDPCREDADCKLEHLPICDPVRQVCIPGCTFDALTKRTDGCAQGRVCHMTPEGSDPTLLNACETAELYGLGSCGPPCQGDEECALVDPSFVCMDDGGGKRCRPAGCTQDDECTGRGGGYESYCDVASGSCVYDSCRLGDDHRLGCGLEKEFADCAGGFKCVGDIRDGVGACVEKNCIEQGGGRSVCAIGNFCAGEPFRDPVSRKPIERIIEAPAGVEEGACFPMEEDLWCDSLCETDLDCGAFEAPSSYAGSPPHCGNYGLDEDNRCFWGCEFLEDCPVEWSCSSVGFEVECGYIDDGGGVQICESDADCGGTSKCKLAKLNGGLLLPTDEEKEAIKVCECDESLACSPGFSCNAGIATAPKIPGEPGFEEIQARYCSNSSRCGDQGSCEWQGETREKWEEWGVIRDYPVSFCLVAPPSMDGVIATCPAQDADGKPARAGKSFTNQYQCVTTSICQPGYSPPEYEQGSFTCGAR